MFHDFTRFNILPIRKMGLNFLENPAIPPDNNASERGLRKVKIKMKNSGTFRSDKGADAFLDILSIWKQPKNTINQHMALFELCSKFE